jgi:hypothetical protein
MTTSQLILMTTLYLAIFVGVAYLTRARVPRIAGALGAGAVFGVIALFALALGETQGWWRVPKTGSSHFQLLLWIGLAVSCAPVYLITWRVARRFGGLGLAVFALAAVLIGPRATTWSPQRSRTGSPSRRASRRSSPSPRSMPCW